MEDLLSFSLSVLTGFIAIMNPVANVPIFNALTDGMNLRERKEISSKSTLYAFIIVALFVLLGKLIFEIFGITVPAFKITGGLLILQVGFEMLSSKKPKSKHNEGVELDENIAISPLAIPVLAGPGTIVTASNFVADSNFIRIAIVLVIFGFVCWLTKVCFNLSQKIVKRLGANVIKVIGKIMGLIIAIIGTTMIIEGIKLAFNLE
ncbi:MarC family protein [Algoriphagus namhaensis]